jgi:hypothetical protein
VAGEKSTPSSLLVRRNAMTSLYKYGRVAIAAMDFDKMKQFYGQILEQEPARHIKDV